MQLCLISSILSWTLCLEGYTLQVGSNDHNLRIAALPTELATSSLYVDLASSFFAFSMIACGGIAFFEAVWLTPKRMKPTACRWTAAWTVFALSIGLLEATIFAWATYSRSDSGEKLEMNVIRDLHGQPYPGRWSWAGWIEALERLPHMEEERSRPLRLMALVLQTKLWNTLVLGSLCCTLVVVSVILQQRWYEHECASVFAQTHHEPSATPEENSESIVSRSPTPLARFIQEDEPYGHAKKRGGRRSSFPPASPSSRTPLLESSSF